jgi:hypothetical protein
MVQNWKRIRFGTDFQKKILLETEFYIESYNQPQKKDGKW